MTNRVELSISERSPFAAGQEFGAVGAYERLAYVEAITTAARQLVEERLMLEEDVERAVTVATDWCRPRHDITLL